MSARPGAKGLARAAVLVSILAGTVVAVPMAGRIAVTAAIPSCPQPVDGPVPHVNSTADAQKLVGLTRAEVVARFGEPTVSRFDDWQMSYWLRSRGFCMDSWYLALELDGRDVVVDARILPG